MYDKDNLPDGHYVYVYLRKHDYLPYYVGRGFGKRAWLQHFSSVTIPHDKERIQIVSDNLTEIGSCMLERKLIRLYGREIDGSGILFNKTEGGETANSNNVKKALAAAKVRGVKLGNPRNFTNEERKKASVKSVKVRQFKSEIFALELEPLINELKSKNMSLNKIANYLNNNLIQTRFCKKWAAMSVKRLLEIIEKTNA
jgi:hypothetical protein